MNNFGLQEVILDFFSLPYMQLNPALFGVGHSKADFLRTVIISVHDTIGYDMLIEGIFESRGRSDGVIPPFPSADGHIGYGVNGGTAIGK